MCTPAILRLCVPASIGSRLPQHGFFALDRPTWDLVLPQAVERLEHLARHGLSRPEFKACAFRNDLPMAYENAILVAAADLARRRGWHDLAAGSMIVCRMRCLFNCGRAGAFDGQRRKNSHGSSSVWRLYSILPTSTW